MASRKKDGLGDQLFRLGFSSEQEVTNFLSQQYRVPTINLDEYDIGADVLRLVSKALCQRHLVIPVSCVSGSLIVAMVDPTDAGALEELATHTGTKIEAVIASKDAILTAINRFYEDS